MLTESKTRRRELPSTGTAPTDPRLLAWLDEVVELCKPAAIHYCDGSAEEGLLSLSTVVWTSPLSPYCAKLRVNRACICVF